MANAYPELPQLDFRPTSVAMPAVVAALNAQPVEAAVKRAGYVMFRNESGNGSKGVNNNYVGAQADSGRWPDALTPDFAGTVTTIENGTNRERIFLAFKDLDGCIAFLMNRVSSRGLFIGGTTHKVLTMQVASPEDLAVAYHREWVQGSPTYNPTSEQLAAFLSMYRQAETLIA